jgi:hypothetical protein
VQSGVQSARWRVRPKPGRLRLAPVGPTRPNAPAASAAPRAATTAARPQPRSSSPRTGPGFWPRPAPKSDATPRPASAGSVSLPLPQSPTVALQTVNTRPLGLCLRHGQAPLRPMSACLPHSLRREATSDNPSTSSPHTFASKPFSAPQGVSRPALSASTLKVRTHRTRAYTPLHHTHDVGDPWTHRVCPPVMSHTHRRPMSGLGGGPPVVGRQCSNSLPLQGSVR